MLRPRFFDDEFPVSPPGIQQKLNKNKNAKKIKKEALKSTHIDTNLKIWAIFIFTPFPPPSPKSDEKLKIKRPQPSYSYINIVYFNLSHFYFYFYLHPPGPKSEGKLIIKISAT